MAKNVKKIPLHISTNIDFEFRSPIFRTILSIVLSVLLVTVAFYQVYVRVKTLKELPTETAVLSTVYQSVTVNAVALRNESVLTSSFSGTVVPMVENGSKVAVSDTVAKVYASSDDAQSASLYKELSAKAEYYEDIAELSPETLSTDITIYDNNIIDRLFELQDCVTQGNLENYSNAITELSESITKKQIVVGKQVDVSSELESIYAQMNQLNSSTGAVSTVTAPAAGFYVNTEDGCEDICDFASVQSLSVDDINSLLKTSTVKHESSLGKIITQFNWYIACVVDISSAELIDVGDRVSIVVDELGGRIITMKLKAKNLSGESAALIFTSNEMDEELATLRFSEITIRLNEQTGFIVNKTAIRTVHNDETNEDEVGVYIQLGNIIRFRKINIINTEFDSEDDVVLVEQELKEEGFLKLYDEILIEGVDYDDGNIVD